MWKSQSSCAPPVDSVIAAAHDLAGHANAPCLQFSGVAYARSYAVPATACGCSDARFTHIEGSTRLLHELGDDTYAELLSDHRRLLRAAFGRAQGVEVDTQGDAFFVLFPDARTALVAVAEAQRALALHAWPGGHAVNVRVGVHTGEPLRTDEGYVGLALHQGARVMACAHGGQVVVSATAASAAGELDGLRLRDLGEHRLEYLSAPQRLFQLSGEGLRPDFPPLATLGGYFTNLPVQPTPLLGRERSSASSRSCSAPTG